MTRYETYSQQATGIKDDLEIWTGVSTITGDVFAGEIYFTNVSDGYPEGVSWETEKTEYFIPMSSVKLLWRNKKTK